MAIAVDNNGSPLTSDVVGFYSLESDISQVKPDPELVKFLEAGEPPIYIG